MPKGTVAEGSEYYYQEGESTILLKSVEEEHVSFTYKSHHQAVKRGEARVGEQGGFDQWVWTVEFVDGPNRGLTIEVKTNPNVELKGYSPARELYEAFLGERLELGQEVNTDILIGQKARGQVSNYEEADKRDPSKVYYRSKLVEPYALDEAVHGASTGGYYGDEPPF